MTGGKTRFFPGATGTRADHRVNCGPSDARTFNPGVLGSNPSGPTSRQVGSFEGGLLGGVLGNTIDLLVTDREHPGLLVFRHGNSAALSPPTPPQRHDDRVSSVDQLNRGIPLLIEHVLKARKEL